VTGPDEIYPKFFGSCLGMRGIVLRSGRRIALPGKFSGYEGSAYRRSGRMDDLPLRGFFGVAREVAEG
jgi:hypothetical protein